MMNNISEKTVISFVYRIINYYVTIGGACAAHQFYNNSLFSAIKPVNVYSFTVVPFINWYAFPSFFQIMAATEVRWGFQLQLFSDEELFGFLASCV